jgi:hypothetical protein
MWKKNMMGFGTSLIEFCRRTPNKVFHHIRHIPIGFVHQIQGFPGSLLTYFQHISEILQAWVTGILNPGSSSSGHDPHDLENMTTTRRMLRQCDSYFHSVVQVFQFHFGRSAREPDAENPLALPVLDPQHGSDAVDDDEDAEPFVKDALAWLIINSQNSPSIDIAIEASAIGKVRFEDEMMQNRINSHLVKHFSDCFASSGVGVKLQLLHHHKMLESALGYSNWMSRFAGGSPEGFSDQILRFHGTLEIESVTRLGLAFSR